MPSSLAKQHREIETGKQIASKSSEKMEFYIKFWKFKSTTESVPSTHIKWLSCITRRLTMCQGASCSQKSIPLIWNLSAVGETQFHFSIWCHLNFTPFLLHHNEITAGMWSEALKPWLLISLQKLTWTFYPLWWELEWNFFLIHSW